MIKDKKEAAAVFRGAVYLLKDVADFFYFSECPEDAETTEPPKEEPGQEKATAPTMIEVRDALSKLAQAGRRDVVKALLSKYGAEKLSDVSTDHYAALLQEARSA